MLKLLIAIGFFENPENLEAWERKGEDICVMSQNYSEEAVALSDQIYLDGVPHEEERVFVPVYKYCIKDTQDTPPPGSKVAKK